MKKYYTGMPRLAFILLFCSNLPAQDWIKVAEIDSTDVYSILSHNESLFAAINTALYRSSDNGNSWDSLAALPEGVDNFETLFSYRDYLYLGTLADGIYRSADAGNSWEAYKTGLPGHITSITALGDSLYAGTAANGIYLRSLNNGSNWKAFNTGLFQLGTNHITTSGHHLVASVGYYLFKRSRTGSSWENISLDEKGAQYHVLETMAAGDYLYVGTDKGVFRGDLNGENIAKAEIDQFAETEVNAFAVSGNRVFAAIAYHGQHWLFTTDDGGQTWDFRFHEFPYLYDMLVFDNKVWAARNDGLWYVDISTWTGIEAEKPTQPGGFYLAQNYPNPFNPVTVIRYQLTAGSEVLLEVYNSTGYKVSTLVAGRKPAGNHSVTFDASHLPSGVYFYALRAGEFSKIRKAVLIK